MTELYKRHIRVEGKPEHLAGYLLTVHDAETGEQITNITSVDLHLEPDLLNVATVTYIEQDEHEKTGLSARPEVSVTALETFTPLEQATAHESDIRALILHAFGEAWMCWSDMPTGEFDSAKVTQIANGLIRDIKEFSLARLKTIEARLEPPRTRQWTRYRGTLLQCLEKVAETYSYTTQEDQGDHDWRIETSGLLQDNGTFTPQALVEKIAQSEQATLPAVLDYDESWFGYSLHKKGAPTESLWVFAKLYVIGDILASALVYRIDFDTEA